MSIQRPTEQSRWKKLMLWTEEMAMKIEGNG